MIIYENSASKNHIDQDCNEGPGVNEDHDPVYHTVIKGKNLNQNLGMHKGPVNQKDNYLQGKAALHS